MAEFYDIRYRAPRRDRNGQIAEEGTVTAWLNGMKVQDNSTFGEPRSKYHPYRHGTTPYLQEIWQRQQKTMTGPLFLCRTMTIPFVSATSGFAHLTIVQPYTNPKLAVPDQVKPNHPSICA